MRSSKHCHHILLPPRSTVLVNMTLQAAVLFTEVMQLLPRDQASLLAEDITSLLVVMQVSQWLCRGGGGMSRGPLRERQRASRIDQ